MLFFPWRMAAVLTATTFVACTTPQPFRLPDVPEILRPPAGQLPSIEALARGVQIYVCSVKSDDSYSWIFRAPEASLTSASGQLIGKHVAGPTWQSTDGSSVVGEVKVSLPSPATSAIPWLLLASKANAGEGAFSGVKSIQRLVTVGGVAPGDPCTAGNVNAVARVPYTATYYFYR